MPKNNTDNMMGGLCNKIYLIRGQKVMLDFDLAEIYGYETRYLNRQVKNNINKFEGEDFMFQLTRLEVEQILMCKNCTSSSETGILMCQNGISSLGREGNLMSQNVTSSWGGIRKLPYAFTESGIYMLMTVLKGDLAVKQSRMLIQVFRTMKDYIVENKALIDRRESLVIANKIIDNTEKIRKIDEKVNKIAGEMTDVVKKSEISPVFLDFARTVENKEFLLLDGEPIQAKEAYMEIYKNAKKKIYIIDNYVSIKTLHLLQIVKQKLEIVFFTDNVCNYLRKTDLEDFRKERPDLEINFIKTCGKIHDRFIILDERKVYQAGSSSKDAGSRMTSIHEISDYFIKKSLFDEVEKMKLNPVLKLR